MASILRKPVFQCAALICLSFLLGSVSWLSWEYNLMALVSAETSDACTMVVGYLLQGAGIGLFALMTNRFHDKAERFFPAFVILHLLFTFPAVMSPYPAAAIAFGFLMNLCFGAIAGYYLLRLAAVDPSRKATTFGIGYGAAILLQWLISLIWKSVYYSEMVLLICAVLTGCVLLVYFSSRHSGKKEEEEEKEDRQEGIPRTEKAEPVPLRFLLSACLLVFLFSVINSSGFAFPSADLSQNVNVELSRLVYAAGLAIAGVVTDRNRKYGAICALTALMMPFIILALRQETVSSVIFWILSYFAFGFYSVYRIILFSDIASGRNLLWLSGFGLLVGRIGDAAGESLCLLLGSQTTWLVCLTAVLFVAAVVVFFSLYGKLYIPERRHDQTEREKFMAFSVAHDLSSRERDMLRLLLEDKTNAEIAAALSISENTVKFHIHNLLQKTGCRNRNDLLAAYASNINA